MSGFVNKFLLTNILASPLISLKSAFWTDSFFSSFYTLLKKLKDNFFSSYDLSDFATRLPPSLNFGAPYQSYLSSSFVSSLINLLLARTIFLSSGLPTDLKLPKLLIPDLMSCSGANILFCIRLIGVDAYDVTLLSSADFDWSFKSF